MKKSVIALASLALLFGFCAPLIAQPSSRAVETFIVDDFDNKGEKNLYQTMVDLDQWTWAVQTSRNINKDAGFPKFGYFDGQPNSLKALNKDKDAQPKVLGVKTSFLRKGENWFEIYPEVNGKPYEIPFVGTCTQIDFWVWGANYLYYIDLLVRDAEGRVHTLPAGTLSFNGWKNVVVSVPGSIRQRSRLRSGPTTMTFVGFRIRTDPDEYVDDFNIFLDQLKYTTNTLSNIFDGYELKDIDFGGSSSGSSSTSEAK
ncbi:flagellar filament outer layer protein FlaA [Treponema pectinovorum]|uniref:flagellar filament outer layer protein FlaA n=1 Tax=Treponema pectinovorum TaxID=164 RepID=UPI0011CCDCB1|nr:flagellar filament outer layer protein FlaA [Treponema pectinovorum]